MWQGGLAFVTFLGWTQFELLLIINRGGGLSPSTEFFGVC
jgi:hypothetical protein